MFVSWSEPSTIATPLVALEGTPVAWAIGATLTERVLLWLAASGGAILVERFSEERTHGVLRTTAGDGIVERKTG